MAKTYKNIGGSHTCLDKTVVPNGGFITTDEDLIKKWRNKFVVVDPADSKGSPATAPQSPVVSRDPLNPVSTPPKAPEAPKAPEKKADEDAAKDVTEDFPTAKSAGLVVKHDKRGYWVFDGATEPAHEKPKRGKKDVTKFLDEYLKD